MNEARAVYVYVAVDEGGAVRWNLSGLSRAAVRENIMRLEDDLGRMGASPISPLRIRRARVTIFGS